MAVQNKVHLYIPGMKVLCGSKNAKSLTTDPDKATCFKCLPAYRKNKTWYNSQVEKAVREDRLASSTPTWEEWSKDISNRMLARKLVEPVREVLKSMDICRNCGNPVLMMVVKGTGVCSENCKQALEESNAF
jgi:hypothetical protein